MVLVIVKSVLVMTQKQIQKMVRMKIKVTLAIES